MFCTVKYDLQAVAVEHFADARLSPPTGYTYNTYKYAVVLLQVIHISTTFYVFYVFYLT